VTNMIKVLDSNTKKQFGEVSRKLKRVTLVEIDVADLKANGIGSNSDVKMPSGGFSNDQAGQVQQVLATVIEHT